MTTNYVHAVYFSGQSKMFLRYLNNDVVQWWDDGFYTIWIIQIETVFRNTEIRNRNKVSSVKWKYMLSLRIQKSFQYSYSDGSMQDCNISIANALEIL